MKKIEALKALKQRKRAKKRQKDRKKDTRCKILLGGTVVAFMQRGEEPGRLIYDRALRMCRESDRLLLESWLEYEARSWE